MANIPTIFVRYEDLIKDPAPVLKDVFKFVFNISDISGTVLEKRIEEVSYFSSRINENEIVEKELQAMSLEQRLAVTNTLASYIDFFGYQSNLTAEALYTTAVSTQVKEDDENEALQKHAKNLSITLADGKSSPCQDFNEKTLDLLCSASSAEAPMPTPSFLFTQVDVDRKNTRPIQEKFSVSIKSRTSDGILK